MSRAGSLLAVPPQHGAWAFLVVPLMLAAIAGARGTAAMVFAATWVIAYPATYFGGRALIYRLRNGAGSRKAAAAARSTLVWGAGLAVGSIALTLHQPWIAIPGAVVAAIWGCSMVLTLRGRERGITNDLVLVILASVAPVLMWQVASGAASPVATPWAIRVAAMASLLLFIGSVVHVKSLIRESDDARWHWASVIVHLAALALAAWMSWWLVIPFGLALLRTVVMRPGLRPGAIGMVELVVCITLVITFAFIPTT
ncbi:MAG: YwiC-like family protein [Candidatus Nanopelagicales bacterium]|nr:YwiC-like family protein [Candidatus Nanopelagicales bacterium]